MMRQKYGFAAVGVALVFLFTGCSKSANAPMPASQRVSFYGDPSRMPQSVKNQIATQQQEAAQNAAQQRLRDLARQAPPQ